MHTFKFLIKVLVAKITLRDGQNLLKGNSSRKESNRIANIRGVSADSMAPASANRETGLITPKFRLPTESEWEYAALGLKEVREFNVYQARKKYPLARTIYQNRSKKKP